MADAHERHMRRAIETAQGNPQAPFGCVIADRETGEVVAEGLNDALKSPVLHGEMAAIISLFEGRPDVDPSRLVLYTTAEPCPMCSGAILWAGIRRVVLGARISTLKRLGLPQIDITCEEISRRASFGGFEVTYGVLERECDALFEGLATRTDALGGDALRPHARPAAAWTTSRCINVLAAGPETDDRRAVDQPLGDIVIDAPGAARFPPPCWVLPPVVLPAASWWRGRPSQTRGHREGLARKPS